MDPTKAKQYADTMEGDLGIGYAIHYADRIANANGQDQEDYREAARLLRAKRDLQLREAEKMRRSQAGRVPDWVRSGRHG
jgi:hypothetical protein